MGNACSKPTKQCPHCTLVLEESKLTDHTKSCTKRPVQCNVCHTTLASDLLAPHKNSDDCKSTCALCSKSVPTRALSNHSANDCRCRAATCETCGFESTVEGLELHAAAIDEADNTPVCKHMVMCPKCNVSVWDQILDEHKAKFCGQRDVVCSVCFGVMSAEELARHGACAAPRIRGVCGMEMTPELLVTQLRPGGAAQRAGVRVGDMLVSVNGTLITTRTEFTQQTREVAAGEVVTLELVEGKKKNSTQSRQVQITYDRPGDLFRRIKGRSMVMVGNSGDDVGTAEAILCNEERFDIVCRQCFEMTDTDKGGFLDRDELKELIFKICSASHAELPTPEELEALFRRVDENDDGKITLDEFKPLMKDLLQTCIDDMKQHQQQQQ
eukprot:PhM_4_TR4964/c2_g1_i1/m.56963